MKTGTLGSRLGEYLDRVKMSQAELGRRAGVKQQTISYLISSGAESSAYAVRIASALGVNPAWLQDGVGSPLDPMVSVGSGDGEVTRAHWVPRVGMHEITAFLESGQSSGHRVVTSVTVGPQAFAVLVAGRSMAPDFSDGDELIVDPSAGHEPGDIVIADVDGAMVLRKYRPLPNRGEPHESFELVAVNPDFPAISSLHQACRLVGVVVEHRRQLRRG